MPRAQMSTIFVYLNSVVKEVRMFFDWKINLLDPLTLHHGLSIHFPILNDISRQHLRTHELPCTNDVLLLDILLTYKHLIFIKIIFLHPPGICSMASPKSMSLSCPATMRKLPGLMSAWMMFRLWTSLMGRILVKDITGWPKKKLALGKYYNSHLEVFEQSKLVILGCWACLCYNQGSSICPQYVHTCVNTHLSHSTHLNGHLIKGFTIFLKPTFFWDTL